MRSKLILILVVILGTTLSIVAINLKNKSSLVKRPSGFVAKNPDGPCYLKWSRDGRIVKITSIDDGQNLVWGDAYFDVFTLQRLSYEEGQRLFVSPNYELQANWPTSDKENGEPALSICGPNQSNCRGLESSTQADYGIELFSTRETVWHVLAYQFINDQETISVLGGSRALSTWNIHSGELIKRINLPQGDSINVVAISPDGSLIATFSNERGRNIIVSDTDSGKKLFAFPSNSLQELNFSHNSKILFSLGDKLSEEDLVEYKQAIFYDMHTGKLLWRYNHPIEATPIFLEDDRQVLLATKQKLEICNVKTGKVIRSLSQRSGEIYQTALSPDGATVWTTGKNGAIWSWKIH